MSNIRNTGTIIQSDRVETLNFEPIKGYPMLNWRGKRPFTGTYFYPAQLKEQHGEAIDGWRNKIYWGDNLQVMSHLLKDYRGAVKLVYIDPPFDSKADYKQRISLRKGAAESDPSAFEEKQYGDIWTNDGYLQFLYERAVLLREMMSEDGSIFVHCDFHKNYLIRCILDEVFGSENLVNEILWRRKGGAALGTMSRLSVATDTIYWYGKSSRYQINSFYVPASSEYIDQQFRYRDANGRRYMITVMRSPAPRPNLMYDYKGYKMPPNGWAVPFATMKLLDEQNRLHFPDSTDKQIYKKIYLDEYKGQQVNNLWSDISTLKGSNAEIVNYPTQKPEELLDRIIKIASNPDDLVFDCFMGSGTTQAASLSLGRRFLGADINLGAIQTTTKRLIGVAKDVISKAKVSTGKLGTSLSLDLALAEDITVIADDEAGSALSKGVDPTTFYTGFEVYNVNNYDVFRNPVEARDLLIEALELQKLQSGHLFDGEKDGRFWKIMPVNKIATRQDLNELINGMDLKVLATRLQENPSQPAEKVTLVCMGHEPDLAPELNRQMANNLGVNAGTKSPLDVEALDILRGRQDLQFKRDSEANVSVDEGLLTIESFYPMNLLDKLSLETQNVTDWREMVDSIMIDWNYDGAIFTPTLVDVPEKNGLVEGKYTVPDDAGTIRVKITDVLSESLEVSVWA